MLFADDTNIQLFFFKRIQTIADSPLSLVPRVHKNTPPPPPLFNQEGQPAGDYIIGPLLTPPIIQTRFIGT